MIMWTIQILLALWVGAAGTMKLVKSKAQLEAATILAVLSVVVAAYR
jgi:hypothetical protein